MEKQDIIVTVVIAGAIILVLLIAAIRIVPAGRVVIVQRLGRYRRTMQAGFNMILPIFDKTLPPISLAERVVDFRPISITLRENQQVSVSFMFFWQIVDAKLFTYYGMTRPLQELEKIALKTVNDTLQNYTYDQLVNRRADLNFQIQIALNKETQAFGVTINRTELKDIIKQ